MNAEAHRLARRVPTALGPYLGKGTLWYCGSNGTVDDPQLGRLASAGALGYGRRFRVKRREPPGLNASDLESGREACARRAWAEAYTALAAADAAGPLPIEDLERLASSAGLSGRVAEALRGLERLYEARLENGEELAAARAAFWLGMRLFSIGEPARGGGWIARAQRLVE